MTDEKSSADIWRDRIIAGESIIPPPIHVREADRALAIFKRLRLTDVRGRPTMGTACGQWTFDLVRAVFGACPDDGESAGVQSIREFFVCIAKKNGKSSIAAGIMLTALILCWRENEEHLIIAPTKEVADNSFKAAASMVSADNELRMLFHVQHHTKTIIHRVNSNSLKVVAADSDTVSGKKAGKVLVDELWLFGKKHNADAMLMEATGGQASRDDGFTIYLTTQSDEPPAGVFRDKLQYFRDVRDGVIDDPSSLPIIYEYPQDMKDANAWEDRSTWHIPNPNLGHSVSADWIAQNLAQRREKTDGQLQQFLAKHLNVEIGLALRSDRWEGAGFWEDAAAPLSLESLIERCEVIDVGIDGGGLNDLLGLYVVGREKGSNRKLGWGRAWAADIALERRKSIAPALRGFASDGDMSIVKNVGDDVAELVQIALDVYDSGLLDQIGCDPAGIGSIAESLEKAGIPKDKIVGISQGWRLGGAVKTTERWLADGSFKPARQNLMAWCAGNARVEQRANGILVTKQSSGQSKIDPLMAMFDAVELMARNPAALGAGPMIFALG